MNFTSEIIHKFLIGLKFMQSSYSWVAYGSAVSVNASYSTVIALIQSLLIQYYTVSWVC